MLTPYLAAVSVLIKVIEGLLPLLGSSGVTTAITTILDTILGLIPNLESNFDNVLQSIKNIISAVKGSGNLTNAQMDEMDAFDAKVDAAFDAAAKAADEADAAAAAAADKPAT